ncbi:MAG: hypothetical protein ABR911_14105 [Syntrophales bacterium]
MINTGKCPKCEKVVYNLKLEAIKINVSFHPRWLGVSYLCPLCNTVLGVSIDPIAIKTDIVNEVVEKLRSR